MKKYIILGGLDNTNPNTSVLFGTTNKTAAIAVYRGLQALLRTQIEEEDAKKFARQYAALSEEYGVDMFSEEDYLDDGLPINWYLDELCEVEKLEVKA